MSAGFVYDLTPKVENEERYAVRTGERRIGLFVLDTTNLATGAIIPSLAPIYADLKARKAYLVRNIKVYAAAEEADTAVKVAKGSPAYAGMYVTNGTKGATVSSVDTSNDDYDVLNLSAALGALAADDVLSEASEEGGTTQKYVANSGLYGRWKVDSGINNVTLLRHAAEIDPDKLVIPYSDADKAKLQGLFEFNE